MIRWEEHHTLPTSAHRIIRGYIGKALIGYIEAYICECYVHFMMDSDEHKYTTQGAAKRGAERMLATFLRDAGLEVKG